jgi:hypothetical protein
MHVVLKKSGRIIGTNGAMPTAGVTSRTELEARAYRCAEGLAWEPDPPPATMRPVEICYEQDRNSKGEFEMIIDEKYEALFRSDPTFKPLPLDLPCRGMDPDLYQPDILRFLQQNAISATKLVSINIKDILGNYTFKHPASKPDPNVNRLAELVAHWIVDALKTHADKVFRQVTIEFSED